MSSFKDFRLFVIVVQYGEGAIIVKNVSESNVQSCILAWVGGHCHSLDGADRLERF